VRRSLMLGALFVLAFPGLALAADAPAAGGWVGPFTVIAATMLARIYVQLAGRDAQPSVPSSGI